MRVSCSIAARLALASLAFATAAAATSVTGTVRTAGTHVPLASMVVSAYGRTGIVQGTATSDSAGHYALSLQAGDYRILAYDPTGAYAPTFDGDADSFDTSPETSVSTQPISIDFALQIGGKVAGTISTAGQPLAQATVAAYNLSGSRRAFSTTDASGDYAIVLPPGTYRIVAYDDAGFFAPRFYPDQYGFDQAASVSITASQTTAAKDIHLEFAAHLGGTVTDAATGIPLEGMTVYAYANGLAFAQADTNGDGLFRLNVPTNSYRLIATDRNLVYATGFFGDSESFDSSLAVPTTASQSRLDLQLPLHLGAAVPGHVTDPEHNPLAGVQISAYNSDGSQRTRASTAADGSYRLMLPDGMFRMAAWDPQLHWATQFYLDQTAFPKASPLKTAPPAPASAVDFSLVPAAIVSGTVTEAGTNAPAYAVGVAAYDDDDLQVGITQTNDAGRYALALPPGTYRFVVFDAALRYATTYSGNVATFEAAQPLIVSSGSTYTADFTVVRGVHAGGRVTNTAGRPLSTIEIRVLDAQGGRAATAVTSAGGFELALLPGTYVLQAVDPSGHYADAYYDQQSSFENATRFVVQSGASPLPVTFILTQPARRHAVLH